MSGPSRQCQWRIRFRLGGSWLDRRCWRAASRDSDYCWQHQIEWERVEQ